MAIILVNILLAIAWAAVSGSFSVVQLLFGFVLGGAALWLIREQIGGVRHFRGAWNALKLGVIFIIELIKSSIHVAILVLSPWRQLQPAIIAYPLTVESDAEITLLANLITLTPGTLSIDVSDDRRTLYVHAIDAPNPTEVIEDIKTGFEELILRVFNP
ncbi:Na+/H+ antiporter subunit E [Acuticoccus sp. M5D2P5]|uniref:Na+/H+ antiporter subunit E n=1 Tax=Acuticoccus kalidii TaxID=2910977 RepID=UPI001F3E1C5D|nr:Na+/H+ antiporter subunit E [Acuticoccus kalidii]MCF3935594.1 Na+/H+ antiporter subunit E [Acuticoccus kalidii]